MSGNPSWLARARNLAKAAVRGRPQVGATPADVIHTENKWRLLRYRPVGEIRHDSPVLLVPSLINRHYVLDLQPGKSFAEYLVHQGHDVYVIDWGTPGPEDRFVTFDDVCDRYLGRAVRRVARRSPTGGVQLLGYCLGGTLTTIFAAARPEYIDSMALLAAPIDFHVPGILEKWTRSPGFDVDALVDGFGNVPWPLMQASFHLLKPTMNMAKLVGVIDRAWDDTFLDGFMAIETWGNDNVSFPGECYRRYISELYRDNALVQGTFRLSGDAARLENIECPLLVVSFEHDHIVPTASAQAILGLAGSTDIQHLHLHGGHVGAVVSRKASQTLWPQLSGFFASVGSPAASS